MLPKYLKPYAKFVAAAGGIGLMVWTRHAGILIPGLDYLVQDLLIGALTSLGVYQVRNSAAPPKPAVKK
jgi:hypothetical protein